MSRVRLQAALECVRVAKDVLISASPGIPFLGKRGNWSTKVSRRWGHKLENCPTNPRFLRTEVGVGYRLLVD